MAAPRAHVFVAELDHPTLSSADRHHLERVLRLRSGDPLTVSDGAGGWRSCRFGPELEPTGEIHLDERPSPPVAVAFALTKGERPEWTVQKLTELGVDRIVAFVAARSIVRWTPEQAANHAERWRRIAREASSQSRRTWLPEVEEVATFASVVRRSGSVLADQAGEPPVLPSGPVLVGPEGGWDDAEREEAAATGVPRMLLGAHVLRAETAALAAATLLTALRGGVVRPVRF